MEVLQEKINEITGFNCNEKELQEIINHVINPHFKTFKEVAEKDITDRDFKLVIKPDKTLIKEMQDFIYKTDLGYELQYNYHTKLLSIYDPNGQEIILSSKIINTLQFEQIMESQSLYICE